jgi:hypothetical protein
MNVRVFPPPCPGHVSFCVRIFRWHISFVQTGVAASEFFGVSKGKCSSQVGKATFQKHSQATDKITCLIFQKHYHTQLAKISPAFTEPNSSLLKQTPWLFIRKRYINRKTTDSRRSLVPTLRIEGYCEGSAMGPPRPLISVP